MAAPPRTLVLVHGSWHGGWCWSRVTPLLRARGIAFHAPSLTGHGDRHHLVSPAVDLSTHVADIANLIRWEDLKDVVLCGHSYGGMVVSGVADQLAERIHTLVYLDAHVPADGQSMMDLAGDEVRERLTRRAKEQGFGWLMPPTPADFFGTTEKADQDWVNGLCTPMPLACYEEKIRLTGKLDRVGRRVYLRLTEHRRPYFIAAADRHRGVAGWEVVDLPTAHNIMVTHPRLLADQLVRLATDV
jgi:pimeloyl-ACP methyl ester carboxylesterase